VYNIVHIPTIIYGRGDNVKKFNIEREEYINKTFKIPVKLVEKMNEICDNKNVSLNKLVVKCIEYALENSDMDE
jgi:predicted HicB family RNase H-like nuclease